MHKMLTEESHVHVPAPASNAMRAFSDLFLDWVLCHAGKWDKLHNILREGINFGLS